MAYGIKYQGSFESVSEETYTVNILEKDYVDGVTPIALSGVPVRHAWTTDEPQPPIKGSSLVVSILNTGVGQRSISADVQLQWFVMTGVSWIFVTNTEFIPEIGVPFTISGHPDPNANGTWTPEAVAYLAPGSYRVDLLIGALSSSSANAGAIVSYESTGLPITSFYSENDDQFKVQLYHNSQLLFEGFLVQDDCSELMVDYLHEIVLSFNDNLGLLKDISLNSNVPDFGGYPASAYFDFISILPSNNCFIYLYNTDFIPVVAVPFTIGGHIEGAANATWTPTAVTLLGNGNWQVQVADFSFIDLQAWPCIISGSATINLYNRNTLLNIIRVCLFNTSLELPTSIYANIFEVSQDVDRSFLEQTYIDAQTFINGESFMDCYQVLELILDRFNLTLFQANGVWNIVRWQEMRYYPSTKEIPCFTYDSNLEYTGTGVFDKFISSGFEEVSYPETGLTRSIVRPWNFDKETFNYKQPKYLLRNFDLQDLGTFITSYVSGLNTHYEYEFNSWFLNGVGSPPLEHFIRVVKLNATGEEIERYAVLVGEPTTMSLAVKSTPFEVSTGDRLVFDCTFRTVASKPGPFNLIFGLQLYDGTTTLYAGNSPIIQWDNVGWFMAIPSGDDTNSEHTVSITSAPVPFDGLITCFLQQVDDPGLGETHIKDIRLTYTPFINDSIKITGQVHTSSQDAVIKNNEAVEINLDDSPRNSIVGTLFKPSFTSLIQDKTSRWYRLTNPSETLRIGEITTLEQLTWRQVPRTKLEGRFFGLTDISMLAILTNNALPGLNFIFGMLEIDYKNNSWSGTQYEIYEDGEELLTREAIDYIFKYLYSSN